jgi:hypothetical protein
MKLSDYGLIPHECATVKAGDRFGRIVILATGKKPTGYHYRAVYQCDCGNIKMTQLGSIQIGTTRSCGCKNREDTTKHGFWSSPLYRVWRHMLDRCENPSNPRFADYGARSITVCKRWHDLEKFHADMSESYEDGLQLDRIDNNKGYEPSNCKWSTKGQQMRNRRNNIFVTIDGETKILKDWANHFGVNYHSVYHRVTKMGWEPLLALTTPSMRQPRGKPKASA